MDRATNQTMATREMPMALTRDSKDPNRVRVSFMSEEPCEMWYGREVMLATPEACDLTRFKNGVAPVLFNHNPNIIVGKMENVKFENGKGYADIVFDGDETAQAIKKKVDSGSLHGTSVGYMRNIVTRVGKGEVYDGRFEGPCDVVNRWELLEFSLVSIPADPTVGVGRKLNVEKGEKSMSEPIKEPKTEPKTEPVQKSINEDDVKRAAAEAAEKARKAEVERVRGITDLARRFKLSDEQYDSLLDCKTLEEARQATLEFLEKRAEPKPVTVRKDEGDKVRDLMTKGLEVRYGLEKSDEREELNYSHYSLKDMARDILEAEKPSERSMIHTMSPDDVWTRAMSSSTFTGIVDDFSHKSMGNAYNEQPVIFPQLVTRGSNTDFKPNYKYIVGAADMLPVRMGEESGEFTYGDMTDKKVSTQIATYGKGIRLTREIFINDALGEVNRAIQGQAKGFRRLQEMMFFEVFLNAKNFSKANGNLVTQNPGVSTKAFAEMERLMLEQTSFDSTTKNKVYIGVQPRYVLVPSTLSAEVAQFLASTADPAGANSGVANIFAGRLTMLQSPYLTANDENAFYFLAAPGQIDGIEFTTLNGNDTPIGRTVVPDEHLGIEYQMYMDFGFNLLGVQGFVKNPGVKG